MTGWISLLGAILLSCAVSASTTPPPEKGAPATDSTPVPGRDRYLDTRYRLLTPDGPPDERQVASGCYSATAAAISEMEEGGAIVDPTYDENVVRNLSCRWASDEPRIAECRFEQAMVPFSLAYEEARKADYIARLRERDWSPGSARFALVAWANPRISTEPRWIATDTCEPFVFDAGDFVIDLREMARRRRAAGQASPR